MLNIIFGLNCAVKNERPAVFHVAGGRGAGQGDTARERGGKTEGGVCPAGGWAASAPLHPAGQLSGGLLDVQGFPEALETLRQQNLNHQR